MSEASTKQRGGSAAIFDVLRQINGCLLAIVAAAAFAGLVAWLFLEHAEVIKQELEAFVVVPFACAAAFAVTTFFHQSETPISLKLAKVEIKGSTGEVLLWLIVFCVVAYTSHILWRSA